MAQDHKYVWQMITKGGADSFDVTNATVVARMAKWASEKQPFVHSYGQYDWSDLWSPVVRRLD